MILPKIAALCMSIMAMLGNHEMRNNVLKISDVNRITLTPKGTRFEVIGTQTILCKGSQRILLEKIAHIYDNRVVIGRFTFSLNSIMRGDVFEHVDGTSLVLKQISSKIILGKEFRKMGKINGVGLGYFSNYTTFHQVYDSKKNGNGCGRKRLYSEFYFE
jgi:hypothetical protein